MLQELKARATDAFRWPIPFPVLLQVLDNIINVFSGTADMKYATEGGVETYKCWVGKRNASFTMVPEDDFTQGRNASRLLVDVEFNCIYVVLLQVRSLLPTLA